MVQPQTVTGFFDNKAEAQQAVQRLLGFGFTAEHVDFTTLPGSANDRIAHETPTAEERNTGRFLSSLFGDNDITQSDRHNLSTAGEAAIRRNTIRVTVQVQSVAEVDQAVDLLKDALIVNVSKLAE